MKGFSEGTLYAAHEQYVCLWPPSVTGCGPCAYEDSHFESGISGGAIDILRALDKIEKGQDLCAKSGNWWLVTRRDITDKRCNACVGGITTYLAQPKPMPKRRIIILWPSGNFEAPEALRCETRVTCISI
jgi:hypothetical protein